ncbi:MAG TPA: hypothetical protein DHV62_09785 [Elusimicrobia bacterium]|jgi:DNA-binding response OmpR family regulator|nr:hypothetical protein [Elusimicrobiota bacterium]
MPESSEEMKEKILVMSNEKNIYEGIKTALEDFEVSHVFDVGEGIRKAREERPDLIILELAFPGEASGFEICKTLKTDEKTEQIPIAMLKGKSLKKKDETEGLELGVEEYIKKPINPSILRKTMRKVLNRANLEKMSRMVLKRGDISMHAVPLMAKIRRRRIHITAKEFDFLYLLMVRPGEILTREYLCQTLWNCDVRNRREAKIIEATMKKIRAKFGEKHRNRIKTIKHKGYFFAG